MSTPTPTRLRPRIEIAAICLAIVALLWAALIFDFQRTENRAIRQAGADAGNLAMAFRENVKRTIGAIDQLMLTIMAENAESGDLYHIPAWVQHSPLLEGMSVQVSATGPDGFMRASNLGSVVGKLDLSDRPHFKYHRDPTAPQPYISVPVIGRYSGKWSIQVTRRLTAKDGSFGGVLVVSIDPFYFSRFFERVDLGSGGDVDLIGRDGIVRARRARDNSKLGQDVSGTELFKQMGTSDSGSEITRGVLDGVTRIYGYSAVSDYPLVVAVGLARGDVMAPVRRQLRLYFAVGGILSAVIMALGWLLAREMARRRRHELAFLAEEKTREQRLLLDTALNNMQHGFVLFGPDGRALVVNRSYLQMYRLSRDSAKRGCTIRDLLQQRMASGTFAGDIDAYIADRFLREREVDETVDTPDGRSIRVVNRFMPNGGFVSVHEEVTERVRAEQERDRNREFLHRIIDNVSVTIHVKDARTLRYVLVNKAAEKLWGMPREAMLGKTPHEIYDKETADVIVEHDRQLLEATTNFYVPAHEIQTPTDGARIVTSNRIAVRDSKGEAQYLLGVVEDVTERTAVEDQLRQAQKMEAVGNLTGGVAHDFNNLLTIIMGNLDLLQDEIADNRAAIEMVKVILGAAERGADLARYMLAFSRRQPLQAKPVDVNDLIATTLRLLNRTLGENIAVDVQVAPDPPVALVDPSQLETAILNIAINARDAMPSGGTLTIGTRLAALDESYAAGHPDVASGPYVAIEITDTGTGMPAAVLERIFDPFFTTKAHGHGTGLGLSMVYGFIKQSGGHVCAYSEVGRGTVFKLFLPMADPVAVEAPPLQPAMRPAGRDGHEVILAVEDNPDIRATVVRQLRDLGYRVHEADSADAALAIIDAVGPIDLLFTDVVMPGKLNGKELAIKARALRANLKVLFTSGFPGGSNAHGAQLDSTDVLLSKPYHKRDLAKAVDEALNGAG